MLKNTVYAPKTLSSLFSCHREEALSTSSMPYGQFDSWRVHLLLCSTVARSLHTLSAHQDRAFNLAFKQAEMSEARSHTEEHYTGDGAPSTQAMGRLICSC